MGGKTNDTIICVFNKLRHKHGGVSIEMHALSGYSMLRCMIVITLMGITPMSINKPICHKTN